MNGLIYEREDFPIYLFSFFLFFFTRFLNVRFFETTRRINEFERFRNYIDSIIIFIKLIDERKEFSTFNYYEYIDERKDFKAMAVTIKQFIN